MDEPQRFRDKYTRTKGCWLWTGARCRRTGKGSFSWDGKIRLAHRVAYTLFVGEIPDGLCVLHKCDVPACVNPEHLFLGTQQDNIRDMCSKNRGATGERSGRAKLCNADVALIKRRLIAGASHSQLAREFSISRSVITKISLTEIWRNVDI